MAKNFHLVLVLAFLAFSALAGLPREGGDKVLLVPLERDGPRAMSASDPAFAKPRAAPSYMAGPPIRIDFEGSREREAESPSSYAPGPPIRMDFEGARERLSETRPMYRPGPPIRIDFEGVRGREGGSSARTTDRD